MFPDLVRRLEGSIVVLEPLAPGHEQGLFAAARDPAIWRWLPSYAAESEEAFRVWFDDALQATRAGTEGVFAILDRRDGRPVGSTRLMGLRPEHRSLEIGWVWLERAAWSTGANAESALLQLEHAFDRLGSLRVEFKTDSRNERSRAALAALPAHFEGIARRHMLVRGGERRDSAWYSVIAEEWPAVRASLEARVERALAARSPD